MRYILDYIILILNTLLIVFIGMIPINTIYYLVLSIFCFIFLSLFTKLNYNLFFTYGDTVILPKGLIKRKLPSQCSFYPSVIFFITMLLVSLYLSSETYIFTNIIIIFFLNFYLYVCGLMYFNIGSLLSGYKIYYFSTDMCSSYGDSVDYICIITKDNIYSVGGLFVDNASKITLIRLGKGVFFMKT